MNRVNCSQENSDEEYDYTNEEPLKSETEDDIFRGSYDEDDNDVDYCD